MDCGATGCDQESAMAWERRMTDAEVTHYHSTGDLPAHETSGNLMVYACAEHLLDPVELMSRTHDAVCHAPNDPGDCAVCSASGDD